MDADELLTKNEGERVRFWRKQILHWCNTQELVDLYNEAMESELPPASIRWWQRMEKENKVPVDLKRRWIITTLLNMPPAYLALKNLAPLYPKQQPTLSLPVSTQHRIDFSEYDKKLRYFWRHGFIREDVLLPDIYSRTHALQEEVLYSDGNQNDQATVLLIKYLILLGNILRDMGYTSALIYLKRAEKIARETHNDELLAKALYVQGFTYLERWELLPEKDQTDRDNALKTLGEAYALARRETASGAVISAEWGRTLAYVAQDRDDRIKAISKIDTALNVVTSKNFQSDPCFIDVDDVWCHIDKTDAFLALNWPKSALQEVTEKPRGNYHARRRYLTLDIFEAQAYATTDQIEMCVAFLERVLPMAQDTKSYRRLTRISNIYDHLRSNPLYQTSPDVARLGIQLMKVRLPEVFV